MDRKECANGLQLIKVASIKLKGKFSALFLGALAMTTPLILTLFIGVLMSTMFGIGWVLPVAIVIFAILVAPLQMGYIKYFNNVIDGHQPRINEVYSYLIKPKAITLRAIYISCILMVMYIIGGMLWIAPAGFAVAFFSMVLFFLQKEEHMKLRGAMKECATKMCGNRLAMFSYKLIFYLVYGMLFVLAGLMLLLIYSLLMDSVIVSWVVSVCCAIVFIFMYTFITVYFHSCNQIFFEDVLSRHEKKKASNKVTHANLNNTASVGEDNQEDKVVEVKENTTKEKESKKKKTTTKDKTKNTKKTKTTTSKPKTENIENSASESKE